jgi:hypothetical protein
MTRGARTVPSVVPSLFAIVLAATVARATCGDGMLDSGEQCDLGAGNGTAATCCTNLCEFRAGGATCRPAAGACDVAETCSGTSGICPADQFRPANFICRASAGVCDVQETCTGSSAACPPDAFEPAGTFCRPSAGVCDLSEFCTGASVSCPADAKSTGVCRPAAGPCDVAESCDGASNDCPPDALATAGTPCRAAADVCDVAESCTGSDAACPADGFAAEGTECRASAGVCDPAESCTGSSAACPADAKSSAVCRPAAGVCDVAESCDGAGNDCPPEVKSTAQCRAASGPCDVAESCDGVGDDCPADGFAPAGTTCRPAAGACDLAETCTGDGPGCPADAKSTAVCRAAAGACDVAESCDGASNDCPPDAFVPAGTVCRPAAPQCDVAESCTGLGPACPPDAFEPDGSACDDGVACTADACSGGVCVGTPNVDACVDDRLCYKTKTTQGVSPATVHLEDRFETGDFQVVRGRDLCTPADRNGTGILDTETHLRSYAIKAVPGSPKHQRRTGLLVTNDVGTLRVDTVKPELLLVPANEDPTTTPPAPDPLANGVDHFKCYKVKVSPGTTPFPKGQAVSLADEFTSPPKSFLLKKPRHLCTPANANGGDVKNPAVDLFCYRVKGGVPRHVPRLGVHLNDDLGPEIVDTVKEDEACVPSSTSQSPSGAFLDALP